MLSCVASIRMQKMTTPQRRQGGHRQQTPQAQGLEAGPGQEAVAQAKADREMDAINVT
jgi:hypothetical protein